MPSLRGEAPSHHLRGEGQKKLLHYLLSRVGGTLASAPPSEGVYALVLCALVLIWSRFPAGLVFLLYLSRAERPLALAMGM